MSPNPQEEPEQYEEVDTQDGSISSASFRPPKEKDVRWMADYSLLYWELKARLSGGWLDTNERGHYIIKKPKNAIPFMNAEGIENTMTIINGYVTKIQAYSIYDEERIKEWCGEIDWVLCKLYFANMERYDLTPDKADTVVRFIMNAIESNMRKSIEGAALQGLSQSERITEVRTTQQQKGKLFGVI